MLTRAPRQAAVFASGGHFLSTTIFERRLRLAPFRRRTTRFFSVLDPLPKLIAQLNAFQPAMLGTYASALAALTEEQEAGRLRISPLVITSGGELLTPAVQRRAEEAFGCLVNQTYGASEAIPLALPCRYGRLHLNSDWFVVEPIDAEGRPLPLLLPMAVATVVEETRGVRRYHVLQTATTVITVRLDHEPGTDRAEVWQRVRAGLAYLLHAHGCGGVSLRLATEPPQVNPRSGKLRRVLRSFPPGAG
jgi:phenylacetate-coenzyme A ligase PaaK-like adenylate-forming protein